MLTARQRETLDFIATYSAEKLHSPSYEEIMVALGLRSKSGINRLVRCLCERGFLRMRSGQARSLEVVQPTTGILVTFTREEYLGGLRFDPGQYRIIRVDQEETSQ